MMTGGRILGHAAELLPLASTRLLIVGFQAECTLGRELLDGKKEITIHGHTIPVNASVRKSSGMSAHADQQKLRTWLRSIQGVRKVYLTHGEDIPRQVLRTEILREMPTLTVEMPHRGQTDILNLG